MAHITVTVPTFNRAHYLPATLDSVLAQTFQDIDVLIVDDASQDGTEEAVRPYLRDARVRYVRNPANLGLTRNWNRCFSLASGPLVEIMQSDDLIDPEYLAEVSEMFDGHPDLGFMAASARHIDAQGGILDQGDQKPARYVKAGDEAISFFLTEGYPHVSTIVVRKRCIEEAGGYDERIWHGPDVEFDVRMGSRYDVYHAGAVRSSFRRHGGNSANFEFLVKGFLETDLLKFSLAWRLLSKAGALNLGISDVERHIKEISAASALVGAAAATAYERPGLSWYYLRMAARLDKRSLARLQFWKNALMALGFPASSKFLQARHRIRPGDLEQARKFAARFEKN